MHRHRQMMAVRAVTAEVRKTAVMMMIVHCVAVATDVAVEIIAGMTVVVAVELPVQ